MEVLCLSPTDVTHMGEYGDSLRRIAHACLALDFSRIYACFRSEGVYYCHMLCLRSEIQYVGRC